MDRVFTLLIEKDEEGFYVGSVPELPGCHTQARSVPELKKRIKEAVQLYLSERGSPPKGIEFVGVEKIQVTA
jgi:predicted RNase H-like HicB family nuclease